MIDGIESRIWIAHHVSYSEQMSGLLARLRPRRSAAGGDPLPVIGRAVAFALSASLTSLTLAATLA